MTGLDTAKLLGYDPMPPDQANDIPSFEGYGDDRDDSVLDTPTWGELENAAFDSVCEATDGCMVEPDGTCEHGHDSWLLAVGMV